MKVNIWRNIAYFASIYSDLICQHTRCWNFDWIWPIIVVEAKSVSEIEDCILWNLGSIFSNIKMSRLDCSLGHIVWYKEKVEFAINHLWLFNETLIDISPLRRINEFFSFIDVEESLSNSLVHDNESNIWVSWMVLLNSVLVSNNFLELFKFIFNDLLSHWVTDSISIDENMVGHLAFVKISVGLKRSLEIILKNCWRNNFLTFLPLRACLGIILAKIWIIGGYKPNNTLFSLVTNIDTN